MEITLICKIIYKQSFAYEKMSYTIGSFHSTENSEAGTNGTEISGKSSRKFVNS